jgi:hypothetical protein
MGHKAVVNPPQPKLNFHVDEKNGLLWIIHRKVAGSSIRKALGIRRMIRAEEAIPYNLTLRTITVVRHPWDRLTSGMFNPYYVSPEHFAHRIHEEILNREGPHAVDWHLWPQSYVTKGFRIDDVVLFEHLQERWDGLREEYDLPALEHVNRGNGHDWRCPGGTPFDWTPFLPWYEKDFEYFPDWERA